MGEYVLLFFLAVGVITAMTVYFKRAVQARIFDARNTMLNTVVLRAGSSGYYTVDELKSNVLIGYEPYYGNTVARTTYNVDETINLTAGGSTGVFRKDIDNWTNSVVNSETAPPRDAN